MKIRQNHTHLKEYCYQCVQPGMIVQIIVSSDI
jgi:hypothetical protein